MLNPEEYVLLEVGVSLVAKRLGNFHRCMSCMSRVGDSHWHTLRSDCGHHHIQNSSPIWPISYVKEHERTVRTKLQPDGFSQAQIQIFAEASKSFPTKRVARALARLQCRRCCSMVFRSCLYWKIYRKMVHQYPATKRGIYCGFSQKTSLRASKRKKGNTFICGLDMEVFEIMRVPLNHPLLKNVP